MSHPYRSLPDSAFWKRAVAAPHPADVDPVGAFDLKITPQTKVATAGSCFAQHLSRHLRDAGFNYYVTEAGHPIVPASVRSKNNYGLFSARYGNIYTARQLLQLFQRAFRHLTPTEVSWGDGRSFRDPFRPTAQPVGFISLDELVADREQHLAAVRTMFETLDVFIFTLGLTECWRSREDGAVFPLCPGVEGGEFDLQKYEFYNQTVADVVQDLSDFHRLLGEVNPTASIILTVSPVPLVATAQPGAHVLAATTYSKSVLRVAAETLRLGNDNVHYFPSYEIITGAFNRGSYFAADLRNVVEDGVEHVMRLFMSHATGGSLRKASRASGTKNAREDRHLQIAGALIEVECDEVGLEKR